MTDRPDPIDEQLQGYAARWRDALPPTPAVPTDLPTHSAGFGRRGRGVAGWLPLVAAAAVLAVVVVAVRLGQGGTDLGSVGGPTASATTTATSSATATGSAVNNGVVPWVPLPATNPTIPTTTVPASPDPALAQGLPVCRAADLTATTERDGASGTSFLFVTLIGLAGRHACRVEGYPTIEFLANGVPVAIPLGQQPWQSSYLPMLTSYPGAVLVSPDAAAVATLLWQNWCPPSGSQAQIRLSWPGSSGYVTVDGAGGSGACQTNPSTTERYPLRSFTFAPETYTAGTVSTPYDTVVASVTAPKDVVLGGSVDIVVTLTAAADVLLAPCPDQSITLSADSATPRRFAINCSDVASRNSQGQPILAAGVPARFAVKLPVPDQRGDYKFHWTLVLPQGGPQITAGAVLTVR
jgi:hypothetical protein